MIAVVSATVSVVCELARKNPRNYLSLAPQLFRLLTTSANNWMLIKIIKMVNNNWIKRKDKKRERKSETGVL